MERDWSTANLFWIVKNGIKMTGMPAFGPTHDDKTIWNIVAFVNQLPNMTAEQYRALEDEGVAAGEHEH
jgi:mono/diheme cytochrome c family protein